MKEGWKKGPVREVQESRGRDSSHGSYKRCESEPMDRSHLWWSLPSFWWVFVLIQIIVFPTSLWLVLLSSMSDCNCGCQSVSRPQICTCHFVSGTLLISATFTFLPSPQISSCHSRSASYFFFFSCHFSFLSEQIFILGFRILCPPHRTHSEVLLCNPLPETLMTFVSNNFNQNSLINCCSCVSQFSVAEFSRNLFLIIEVETLLSSFMRPSPLLYWETPSLKDFQWEGKLIGIEELGNSFKT